MNHWCFMMQMPILLISCLGFHSLEYQDCRLMDHYCLFVYSVSLMSNHLLKRVDLGCVLGCTPPPPLFAAKFQYSLYVTYEGAAKHFAIAYPPFENFWICPLFHLGNSQKNRYNLKMNVSLTGFALRRSLLF